MEKQIYSAMMDIILGDVRVAYIHMDDVDFKYLLAEIKEVIQSYEDDAH